VLAQSLLPFSLLSLRLLSCRVPRQNNNCEIGASYPSDIVVEQDGVEKLLSTVKSLKASGPD